MSKSFEGSSRFELQTFSIQSFNWPGVGTKEREPATSPRIINPHNTRPKRYHSNYFISRRALAVTPTTLEFLSR